MTEKKLKPGRSSPPPPGFKPIASPQADLFGGPPPEVPAAPESGPVERPKPPPVATRQAQDPAAPRRQFAMVTATAIGRVFVDNRVESVGRTPQGEWFVAFYPGGKRKTVTYFAATVEAAYAKGCADQGGSP